jgi:hypothetical protein
MLDSAYFQVTLVTSALTTLHYAETGIVERLISHVAAMAQPHKPEALGDSLNFTTSTSIITGDIHRARLLIKPQLRRRTKLQVLSAGSHSPFELLRFHYRRAASKPISRGSKREPALVL